MEEQKVWTWEEIKKAWSLIERDYLWWEHAASEMKIYLERTPPEWRPGIALALALEKWKPGAKNRGHGNCALCVLHRVMNHPDSAGDDKHCRECPLAAKDMKCTDHGSLFRKYHFAITGSGGLNGAGAVKLADKIYNLLVECYREEYER